MEVNRGRPRAFLRSGVKWHREVRYRQKVLAPGLLMILYSKDIDLEIPIDGVHPMAVPLDPFIQQQPAPYTYPNHALAPELTSHLITPINRSCTDSTTTSALTSRISTWLWDFTRSSVVTTNRGSSHLFFPDAVPGFLYTPPYPISYQTSVIGSVQPVFMHNLPPTTSTGRSNSDSDFKSIFSQCWCRGTFPRPQLTPAQTFIHILCSITISKSERVEELEKMTDEVAKKHRDLSGDLPKVELDEKANGNDSNLNKTLPGPPVPSGKLRDRSKMG